MSRWMSRVSHISVTNYLLECREEIDSIVGVIDLASSWARESQLLPALYCTERERKSALKKSEYMWDGARRSYARREWERTHLQSQSICEKARGDRTLDVRDICHYEVHETRTRWMSRQRWFSQFTHYDHYDGEYYVKHLIVRKIRMSLTKNDCWVSQSLPMSITEKYRDRSFVRFHEAHTRVFTSFLECSLECTVHPFAITASPLRLEDQMYEFSMFQWTVLFWVEQNWWIVIRCNEADTECTDTLRTKSDLLR